MKLKWLGGLAAALMMIGLVPVVATAVAAPKDPPILVGDHDPEPPVLKGGAYSWQELFDKVGDNSQYWSCFEQRTGHTKADAELALQREREGWNLAVTIVSNTSVDAGDQQLDSKGLQRDPDVVKMDGFSNTRGAGENGCEAFNDERAQVRVALTLPGKDAATPGEPVALAHCGNPIGHEKGAPKPPPSTPSPQPSPPPGSTPPGSIPTTTVPHRPGKCEGQTGPYCGTPDSGPEYIPPQENDPALVAPTPGYPGPGNAEEVIGSQQPRPGSDPYAPTPSGTNTGGSQTGPAPVYNGPGATGGNTPGTNAGVTNDPTGPAATDNNPAAGTNSGQTSPAGSDPGGW